MVTWIDIIGNEKTDHEWKHSIEASFRMTRLYSSWARKNTTRIGVKMGKTQNTEKILEQHTDGVGLLAQY